MQAATPSSTDLALSDFWRGVRSHRIWTMLARQDIIARYRGSVLGPIWLSLSTGVLVVGIGIVYGTLFGLDVSAYLPYLAVGLVVWQLILSLVTEGCLTFLAASGIMRQTPLPLSLYAFRVVTRNMLAFAHNFIVLLAVLLAFGVNFNWGILLAPFGLALIAVNGFLAAMLFGTVSARFRDLPPIVASVLQVLFFVTPILWSVDQLSSGLHLLVYNPIFALIDVVRSSLLGVWPEPTSWPIAIVTTLVLSGATFLLFRRLRSRVAYWI